MPPDEVEPVAGHIFGKLRPGVAADRMGEAVRPGVQCEEQRVPGKAEQEQRRAIGQIQPGQHGPLRAGEGHAGKLVPVPRRHRG